MARKLRRESMKTINHKGYSARIEFDERDNIFLGRVLGLRAMISFHGESLSELHQAFRAAIEDFLPALALPKVEIPHETNRRKTRQN